MNVSVYSTQLTPRVEYIFSTLLAALGITAIQFTDSEDFYRQIKTFKFNYSGSQICDDEIWIQPSILLFEKDIHSQAVESFNCSIPLSPLERAGVRSYYIDFDIFAASFYLLSRYEEYLPHKKDMYGRYAHENSIAFQQRFLDIPLVNVWLQEFRKIIVKKFPSLHLSPPAFRFIPTYDIDIAWSYRHKGIIRNTGGFFKDIFQGNWPAANERMKVLLRKNRDPFDSYEWLNNLHAAQNLHPVYFFLVAEKNKGYDKNILPQKIALQQLIKDQADKYQVGIHPSWQSGEDEKILKKEISLLRKMTGKNIYQSRQHYIRMKLPDTYRKLIQQGITDDYSMGYGSINGFRASYCLPYKWYDLEREETTPLTIHPFCYMDANSFYEQHLTAAQALDEMKHYLKIVQQVNGEMITIWHNHFLGTDKMFEGWREIYETMISDV